MVARRNPQTGEKLSETLARFLVEQVLGLRVCCYDDRRGTSRPDAIIHRNGGVPLEIVSDPLASELELMSALKKHNNPMTVSGLRRGYLVSVSPDARIKDIANRLREMLCELDEQPNCTRWSRPMQGCDSICFAPFLEPGEVLLTSGGGGGRPDVDGSAVVIEASAILARPQYADVARKLAAYGGAERHVVLIVDEDKAAAFSWLHQAELQDVVQLPTPELPSAITHLWITSTLPRDVIMRWSPTAGWRGEKWRWGPPDEALRSWDDPPCLEEHRAVGSFSAGVEP